MRWKIDTIFSSTANDSVLSFLVERSPSAHSDLVSELSLAAQSAPDSHLYCPDKANYAFFAVHRSDYTIVALALGMRQIVFRLPEVLVPEALRDGGTLFTEIGPEWVSFEPSSKSESITDSKQRLGLWCRRALISETEG